MHTISGSPCTACVSNCLDAQAREIGLPLEKMFVSERSSNEEYAERMREILLRYKARGVEHVKFGDIFLEDLRLA